MDNLLVDRYVIFAVLAAFIIAMIIAAYVLKNVTDTQDFETLKIRFAAVTFTGIMLLVLLIGILAISIDSKESTEIFKTIITAMSPIAGGIIGYLFSSKK